MAIAISTKAHRQTRKPRFVALAPRRLRRSPERFANTWDAPPERENQLRTNAISRSNPIKAMPITKISVNHAGSFSGEGAGVGVGVWRKKSASSISGSYFAKPDFDITERN